LVLFEKIVINTSIIIDECDTSIKLFKNNTA